MSYAAATLRIFKLETIKLRCDSAGHHRTALIFFFIKTKPMQLVFFKKKKYCNRKKIIIIHGTSGTQSKEKKNLHTRNMNTWLLLYPTTKACFSLILHVHIFKYTILKCCLYRASHSHEESVSSPLPKENKEIKIHRA